MTTIHDECSHRYSLTRLVTHVRGLASEWRNRRQMAKSLGALSSRSLQDIGLTRDDVHLLESLPLAADASRSLADATKRQSGNW